jgi:hypothetical protein
MSESPRLADLQRKLADAEQHYLSLTGGQTSCEIGKQRQESAGLKAAEGRMQALRDLVNAVKKTPEDFDQVLQTVLQKWQRLSEISELWQVYKQAGLSELKSFQ